MNKQLNELTELGLVVITREAKQIVESEIKNETPYKGNVSELINALLMHDEDTQVAVAMAINQTINQQMERNKNSSTIQQLFYNESKRLLLETISRVEKLMPAI